MKAWVALGFLTVALSCGGILALTASAGEHAKPPTGVSDGNYQTMTDAAMRQMHADMNRAAPTGDADHDFLTMMIPHHQGAVDAARAVLLYGRDPRTLRLAKEILAEQALEIEYMRSLLRQEP